MKRFTSVPQLEKILLPQDASVREAVAIYNSQPDVLYAEPNYIVHALQNIVNPNDPQFPQQWNLHNTGQDGGVPGADIHASEAWAVTTGNTNVILALIDSGVDYTHSDLASQIWTASASYSFVDSQGVQFTCPPGSHGFNAIAGNCDPRDDAGHGTHVAGIMGAATNNSLGVAGISWGVQILPCKFLNNQGFGDTAAAITCLDLVKTLKDSGLNVAASNNSWGGGEFSQSLADAIAAQGQSGVLFIAAAGNDSRDNDLAPTYPADYNLPNILSVAASDRSDQFATFSNLGRRTTHLTAPGDQILSTTPNNTFSILSGTSMAAPHVAGVAALLKAQDSSRDWRAIKNLILSGGDEVPSLAATVTGKRLNASGSLQCSNGAVQSRLLPVQNTVSATAGTRVTVSALSINCAQSAGPVVVTVSPGGQTIPLMDDGSNMDQAAGDGVFTGTWTPSASGNYTIAFPWGDSFQVEVLNAYIFRSTPSSYTTISGTNLNLGDDSVAQITSPFPILYGGGAFPQLFVSSNGTISVTDLYNDFQNAPMPPGELPPLTVAQPTTLLAPWWQDLFPVKGSSQNVFWDVIGAAPNRELIVEWRDVRAFQCNADSSATVRFQVVFFESKSDVQFNYGDTVFSGKCSGEDHGGIATVGLQESLKDAQMFSFRGQTLGDGLSLLWTIPQTPPSANPIPGLTSIFPASTLRGGPPITLTVTGTNFVPDSRIQYLGVDRVTTFVSSTTLTTQLSSRDLDPFLPPSVSVFTPAPGGGSSQQLLLSLLNPAPTISSLNPSSVAAGSLTFNLTVTGSGFVFASSAIYWNGQPLQFFSAASNSNTISAEIPYTLVAHAGTAQITVQSGAPGGGTSNSLPFTITPPQPSSGFQFVAANPAQIPLLAQHIDVDDTGQAHPASGVGWSKPIRFLGWNVARKLGPGYLKYFTRPHAGTGSALQGPQHSTQISKAPTSHIQPLLAPAGAVSPAGFGLRPSLPADFITTSVATGDFNRDGKLDWVVSNGGSGSLWIYFGNGDGTAQLPVIIPLPGQAPLQVSAVDLRKNGILDLVTADPDSGTVDVLLGNGDGTFQPERPLYSPGPAVSVAAADFDGDGKVDIVAGLAGDEFTGPLAFFAGDGTGHFGAPVTRPSENIVGSYLTTTIQLADLNKDGLLDLVVTDFGGVVNGVHTYVSRGDGTFKEASYVFSDGPVVSALNATAADMDGDGCPDVVVSTDSGTVYMFRGSCDGTFSDRLGFSFYGAGDAGAGLAIADINGDGNLDVVTSGITFDVGPFGPPTGDAVAVLFGDGHGKLSPGRIYRGEPGMFSLAIGDLNGDGKLDVLTANQDSDSVSVYLNDGKGGFGDPAGAYVGFFTDGVTGGSINAVYLAPAIVDVNGDGKPDIVFLEYPNASPVAWNLTVLLNDGTGHFGAPIRSPAMEGTLQIQDLQFLDIRGTGKLDLVVLGGSGDVGINNFIGFAPNHGDGTFGPLKLTPFTIGSPWIFAAGDFDGDGKADIVIAGGTGQATGPADRITFLKGDGAGNFTPGSSLDFGNSSTTGGSPRTTLVGDFNGDHKLDLIVAVNDQVIGPGSLPHAVFEFFGNGNGTFQPPVTVIPDACCLTMADLNGDGHPDLVDWIQPITIAGFSTPTYKVHLGQPDGSFVDGQTYAPFSGQVNAFEINSLSPLRFPAPVLADFNGDGNLDILVPQRVPDWDAATGGPTFGRGYLQVLLGNGDGTFTPDFTVFNLGKIFSPTAAADLNGDGRADLVEVDPFPSSYNVIFANSGTSLQAQLVSSPIVGTKGVLRLTLGVASSSATNVVLSSSDPNIVIPSSISIPAAAVTQDVPFTVGPGFNKLREFALMAQSGSAIATAYGTVAVPGAVGIQIAVNTPNESTGPGGTTRDYGLSVFSINGYSTTVSFQCQGLPLGASCQFGRNPAAILPATFATVPLTVSVSSNITRAIYPFTIVATDGNVTSQVGATLGIVDFGLRVSPNSGVVVPGKTVSFSLNVDPLNGWSDAVQISCPITPPGPKCLADGTFVPPGQNTLTIDPQSAPPGDYSFNVTATGAGVTHSASGSFKIEDATVGLSASAATVPVGGTASINVSLTSLNGLSDQFAFACLNAPSGVSCSFNPPSGQLPANGTLGTSLTVQVNSRPQAMIHQVPSAPESPLIWFEIERILVLLFVFAALVVIRKQFTGCYSIQPGRTLVSASVLAVSLLCFSCGGGSGGSVVSPPPPPPPPPSQTVVKIQVQAQSATVTRVSGTITITIP